MSEFETAIRDLARRAGIHAETRDAFGRVNAVPLETMQALLAAFGLPADTPEAAAASLAHVRRLQDGLLPVLVLGRAGRAVTVQLGGAAQTALRWHLIDEAGRVRGETSADAQQAAQDGRAGRLRLPPLAAGYYRLIVESGSTRAEAPLIVAPARCYGLESLGPKLKAWGATAQVYGLRRNGDLGIGDFTAVGDAAEAVGALGGEFLGLSPLHGLFASDRGKISPYSPSSRLFVEPIFIDPVAVPGWEESGAAALLPDEAVLEPLRNAALADHAGVWAVKKPLLEALWAHVQAAGDRSDFLAFRRAQGAALQGHALYEALAEHFRADGRHWVGEWPEAYRDSRNPAVAAFAAEHAARVDFYAWLAFEADRQLGLAAERARRADMAVGLYRDLAVGADRHGSELWAAGLGFAAGVGVGAPPDPLAPQGQNWGLPSFDPFALQATGLAAFRALVAANMRHAGAIRIDHAFQLQRLYLIPEGASADKGAYVDFPFEAMLAVLKLESQRHRCLVIAEDLGTGPDGFSEAIMAAGIFSYRVLSFEKLADGAFKRPDAYPAAAMAVLNTHDMATFRGWWRALDVDMRQSVALYDQQTAERERGVRQQEKEALAAALRAEHLLEPGDRLPEEAPFEAALRYLARTQSALMAVQLEDAAGELAQVNMPGVPDDRHPNWRRRLPVTLEVLAAPGGDLAKVAAAVGAEGRGGRVGGQPLASPPPRATYRIQFHKDFTFADAEALVPYLRELGVSHLYASPVQMARPGSTHGYDIVDHSRINPELGGEEGFEKLTDALAAAGLGLILDIVPNHMGVGGADNAEWLSMLEWGEGSPAAQVFDIDWQRLGANGKIVVPFLGERYGTALEAGQLELKCDAAEGSFSVWHFEHRFPICPLDYPIILDRALAALEEGDAGQHELQAVSETLRTMRDDAAHRAQAVGEAAALKRRLAQALQGSAGLRAGVERAVALLNGLVGVPDSFGTLHRLLEAQAYRLAHWRVAASDINYRRFFDINGLGGIRTELPEVFHKAHELVIRYVKQGRIQGLRIDHIDGLADPEGYLRALQGAVGPGFYVVAEKILEPGEALRDWPLAGTTGYDALNQIDGVLLRRDAEGLFTKLYARFAGVAESYEAQLLQAKEEVLEGSFASELEGLVSDLKRIADADRNTRDFTVIALHRALGEIVERFPVYRSYMVAGAEPAEEDIRLIQDTIARAKRSSRLPDRSVHDFIGDCLLGGIETDGPGKPAAALVQRFVTRFQQLTGPVMAKSLEDTLFYRYARLLVLNEVGGDPAHFGLSLSAFHDAMQERARRYPNAMLGSATHDTKRGEDTRARMLALSEVPAEWEEALRRWEGMRARFVAEAGPDANDAYILLQQILGAWPVELLDGDSAEDWTGFLERMQGFATKALREAKRHSSWIYVDEAYEQAVADMLARVLQPQSDFAVAFRPLAQRLALLGAANTLARTVLKLTLPGVPDLYQGTEGWDLSLVDPDNRRPVDYDLRRSRLGQGPVTPALALHWQTGAIKQATVQALLADRAAAPQLYAMGEYTPMRLRGPGAERIIAYRRNHRGEVRVVVVARHLAGVLQDALQLPPDFLNATRLDLGSGAWVDVLTGRQLDAAGGGVTLNEVLAGLPVAVLRKLP